MSKSERDSSLAPPSASASNAGSSPSTTPTKRSGTLDTRASSQLERVRSLRLSTLMLFALTVSTDQSPTDGEARGAEVGSAAERGRRPRGGGHQGRDACGANGRAQGAQCAQSSYRHRRCCLHVRSSCLCFRDQRCLCACTGSSRLLPALKHLPLLLPRTRTHPLANVDPSHSTRSSPSSPNPLDSLSPMVKRAMRSTCSNASVLASLPFGKSIVVLG